MIVVHITTIPRRYRVSTKRGWKGVLLRRVNRINPNRLRLKQLISIEHDPINFKLYLIHMLDFQQFHEGAFIEEVLEG